MAIVISGQEELEFFELPWAAVFPPSKNFFRTGFIDNFIQLFHPGKLESSEIKWLAPSLETG